MTQIGVERQTLFFHFYYKQQNSKKYTYIRVNSGPRK